MNEKNLKDSEVIKKYFSKIFVVLSEDIRKKLINLNVSDKKKKLIKNELAFLSKEKQNEYLDELCRIYNRIIKGF